MKTSSRSTIKKVSTSSPLKKSTGGIVLKKKISVTVPLQKESVKQSSLAEKKKGRNISSVVHSTKRYSKKTLRSILLSKMFHKTVHFSVISLVLGASIYGGYTYFTKSFANNIVVSQSEIVGRISRLIELPAGSPVAVVRVEDPETLKKQNNFYQNVKDGDYIVVYPKLAVIYDLRNNAVTAIKKSE